MTPTDTIAREHPLNEVGSMATPAARCGRKVDRGPYRSPGLRRWILQMVAEETLEVPSTTLSATARSGARSNHAQIQIADSKSE